MQEVLIDNKKYVILPLNEYEELKKAKILKSYEGKLLTLKEAKERAFARIEKWEQSK